MGPLPALLMELAALAGTALGLILLVRAFRLEELSGRGRLFRLVLPADFEAGAIEQLLLSLHGILRPALRRLVFGQPWVAVELEGTSAGVELRLWIPEMVSPVFLARHVEAAFPGARLEPMEENASRSQRGSIALANLTARGHGLLRLQTPTPGLAALLAGLRGLGSEERVLFQLLAQPLSPWAQRQLLAAANQRLQDRHSNGQRIRASLAARAEAQRMQAKAQAPLFAVSVRALAEANRSERARLRTGAVTAGLHQFGTAELHFARHPILLPKRFIDSVELRRLPLFPAPTALNTLELASVLRLTPEVAQEAGLPIARGRQLAPPAQIAKGDRVLALASGVAGERPVSLPIEEARRHLYVLGPTGTGKTTLLLNLAQQDIEAGRGVIVLDPKGDLVDGLLARFPKAREHDLVLFDPADSAFPLGINMLEASSGTEPELVCDQLVAVFRGIYEQFWGPRTDDILRSAILTLLHEEGATLCEVPLLLGDDAFRARYLEKLDDPVALEPFWAWYERLSSSQRAEAAGPVLNKLRAFLARPRLRHIVGQSRSTLDFGELLRERKVLLVPLAKGLIGEEASALLGSFIVTKLWQATLARAASPEAERPDVVAYLDEFEEMIRLPQSFAEILAQARSLHLSLVLSHQHLSQLPSDLRQSVLANARSRVVFQCGAADARLIARDFEPYLGEEDLRALGAFEVAMALSAGGNTSRPFTAFTRPAEAPTRSDASALRQASRLRYGRPRAEVESEIRSRLESPPLLEEQSFGRHKLSDRPTDRAGEEGSL
jgi:hypothetical protein